MVALSKVTKEMILSGKAIFTFPSASLLCAIEFGATVALSKVTNEIVLPGKAIFTFPSASLVCAIEEVKLRHF